MQKTKSQSIIWVVRKLNFTLGGMSKDLLIMHVSEWP